MTATIAVTTRSTGRTLALALLTLWLLSLGLTGVGAESTAVVLTVGDSTVLRFARMQRVATVDPAIADVAPAGLNELVLLAKAPGRTMVYVWDKRGRHDFAVVVKPRERAQDVAAQLRELLPAGLRYQVLDSQLLLVDGEVPTAVDLQRVNDLIKGVTNQVRVINLVAVVDSRLSPAQRQSVVLERVLGDQYQYVVWDDTTLMVLGQVESKAGLEQVTAIIKAANQGKLIVANLVTVGSPQGPPPTAELAAALGSKFKVWPLRGRTVVVEALVADEATKERADRLLEAFAAQADIVNLVRVTPTAQLPLEERRKLLQEAVGSRLQVRTVGDRALVVSGTVGTDADLKGLEQVVQLFSKDTVVVSQVRVADPGKRQVLAKVRVLDIRKEALDRMGASWGEMRGGDLGTPPWSWLFQVQDLNTERGNVYDFGARLNALIQDNDARVLAQPDLLVNEGEEASILVGGEIPIPVPESSGTGGLTIVITFKPFGVNLKVKPLILADGRVRLLLDPEVSEVDRTLSVEIAGFNIPGFRTRRTHTEVDMANGQTLAIGGLVQENRSEVVNKLPWVGELPIIGDLFKNHEFIEGKSELIILVTPYIVTKEQAPTIQVGPGTNPAP